MKLFWVLAAWLCLIAVSPEVSAEYYQYADKNGIKYFTDNILEVPEEQRPGLGIHQSIKSPEEPEFVEPEPEKITSVVTLESLDIKRDELETEYKRLVEKRELLTEFKKTVDEKAYNERVIQLNREIQEYQEKKMNLTGML